MRLKSIKIKGFKSFPLETNLYFNERVTGVVGPNGSGKSNIVDAIRWVLGEQKTSELRLDAMADVLFNGTKKRKKSGLAQVTLEFDNTKNLIPTEYTSVSVARLLFRSGESEYRINDVPCRLKDVRSLFVDTGIGSDSYAIIALNMVDDILTDSNGSRRRMFEQASGISKYKKRKKETINKLKVTTADLDRVEDLLFEIGNNLQELEKQARKVKRFLKIKEQYQDISIQLQLTRYDEVVENRKKLDAQVKEEKNKHRNFETELRTKEAALQKHKHQILSNEEALSSFQKEINSLLENIRKKESDKQLAVQQIRFNEQKEINTKSELFEIQNKLNSLGLAIEKTREKLGEGKTILKSLELKYKESQTANEKAREKYQGLKTDHDELTLKIRRIEDEVFQFEKSVAVEENQISSLTSLIDRKKEKLKDAEASTKQKKKERRDLGERNELLIKQLSLMEEGLQKRKNNIEILSEKRDKLRNKKDKISRILDARKNEYDLVKSMIDSLEGFPESIKYLNKKWPTKAPLLTDLVYAPDEYKLAIESYLEQYLNYYVVTQTEEAMEALSLLHGSQKGKANFFILDKLDEEIKVTREIDGLRPAIHFLEFDEKYLKLLSRLLHNVYITDLEILDLDIITETLGEEEFFVLEKNGAFISGNYSLSGGSVGLFEGKKLGRKKNLEKLQEEIQKLKNQNVELDSKLVAVRNEISSLEIENSKNETEELKSKINKEKLKLMELDTSLQNVDTHTKMLIQENSQHQKEIDNIKEQILAKKSRSDLKRNELSKLLSGGENSGDLLQELSETLSKTSEQKNNDHISLIKHQNLIDTFTKELSYKENDINQAKEQSLANSKALEQLGKDIIALQDKTDLSEKELVELYKDKSKKEENLSGIEKEYYEKRASITDMEEEISVLRRNMHQSQFLVNEHKEKLQDQEYRLRSVKERLKIEFNLELKDVVDIERMESPLMELEEKHDRLKRKIDNFGEVNTLAVEAYDEMQLRFENITKQKEDILEAKESLLKTIDKIEEIATKKYLETFEVVKEHFKIVFTRLFNEGDTCDITMEDPDKPLESRIEITAKPKGKRPKTLNQLSGGEKTLTAIALLFSLYLYKPAPFCIFDEVDAPLDDANIMKFNRIVKEFSKDSQFIIITHNKATMAAVDVLYGVFMQELGVSEVAAVDFRDYEHLETLTQNN